LCGVRGDLNAKIFLIKIPKTLSRIVVVLSDPFRGMWEYRNSMDVRHSGQVKNGRSSAKDGAPERLRCGTIQKEVSEMQQMMSVGAASIILLPFYPAYVRV